jgi:predicted DNA binding CopG/RHH family protein
MSRKEKCSIPTLDPRASYEAKAHYYERYSTQELVEAGHLEEVGIRKYARQTEILSLRVDKALLTQLKRAAKKKKLPLRTLIRTWLIQHAQEEKAA